MIHANLYGPSIALHLESNRRSPVPTVIAIHSDYSESGGMGNIVRRSLDQAAWVTAVSKATLGDIRSMFPQIKNKSSYIFNGLVTKNIEPRPPPATKSEVPASTPGMGRTLSVSPLSTSLARTKPVYGVSS